MALKTIPLFKSTRCGTQGQAGTITSDPIDIRDIVSLNNMWVTYKLDNAAATCGSSLFTYNVCPVYDGTYVSAGTFGTHGDTKESDIISISSPRLSSFMKINVISGTSNHILVTAELNVV
jgi:hypothetical protein